MSERIDDVDKDHDEDEAQCREASIKMLRRAEAQLAAGDASGVIVVMLDCNGFRGFYRSMMSFRAAYADASAALDYLSGRMHENWATMTMEDADPDGSPLRPVESSDPEET